LFRLPEAYWAAIPTLIVMQSSLGAALPVSVQRFTGTALGGIVGAGVGTYFPANVAAFGVAMFAIGVVAPHSRWSAPAFCTPVAQSLDVDVKFRGHNCPRYCAKGSSRQTPVATLTDRLHFSGKRKKLEWLASNCI
jgi:hypothetical protein